MPSKNELRDRLESAGFEQPWTARRLSWGLVAVLSAGVAVLVTVSVWTRSAEVLAATAAFAAVGIGIWQWALARQEASFDRFYDRLHLANSVILDAYRTLERRSTPSDHDDGRATAPNVAQELYRYFVYTELDNLEYAIAKYRLGYMPPELAARALTVFEDRCDHGLFVIGPSSILRFCNLVQDIVTSAEAGGKDRSYNRCTLKVARGALQRMASPCPPGSPVATFVATSRRRRGRRA